MRLPVKLASIFWIGFLAGNLQQLTHDVSVVNIEVPVRVYDGMRFVDSLTINDFEVYENDVLQKLEALFLVRKTDVVNYFGGIPVVPDPIGQRPKVRLKEDPAIKQRVLLLYFEMDEYPPQTNEAIDYLVQNVLIETDVVLIVTPNEQWKITMSAENMTRRNELAEELKNRLTKALRKAGSYMRVMIRNLRDLAIYEDDFVKKRAMANDILDQILTYKVMDEKRFTAFADFMKPVTGQKHVFIFYQEETYSFPEFILRDWELKIFDRDSKINKKLIEKIFSDAETTVHFIFLKKYKTAKGDVEYQENGAAFDAELNGDIYQAFKNLAVTTGGIVEATYNPIFAMKRAADAAENYYLLYYTPSSPSSKNTFKQIKVKVKSANYRIIHRSGYVEK